MVVSSYVSLFRAKINYQSEVEYLSFLLRKKRGAHTGPHCVPVEVCQPVVGLTDQASVLPDTLATDAIRTVLNNTSLISVF